MDCQCEHLIMSLGGMIIILVIISELSFSLSRSLFSDFVFFFFSGALLVFILLAVECSTPKHLFVDVNEQTVDPVNFCVQYLITEATLLHSTAYLIVLFIFFFFF